MLLCLRGATFPPRCAPGKIALRRTPSSRRSSTTIPAGSVSWRRREACVEIHGRRILISSTNTCARVVRRAIVNVDASPLQSCSGIGQLFIIFAKKLANCKLHGWFLVNVSQNGCNNISGYYCIAIAQLLTNFSIIAQRVARSANIAMRLLRKLAHWRGRGMVAAGLEGSR